MKYGVIYYHNTDNIGDDILSYAGKRFLPQTDYYIDRESLDVFMPEAKEYVATIANGWYLHFPYTFQPSPYLIPLFIGTHFSRDQMVFGDYSYLDGTAADYLRKRGPVGCRDMHTMKILQEKGIDSYFSGCMTLTLPQYPNVIPNHSIVLTDVSDEITTYIQKLLPDQNIICKTHRLKPEEVGAPWPEREARVHEYLKLYQGADLVITTRLHCALPSVALGTPVIFISRYDQDYQDRISSLSDFFHTCSQEDILSGKMNHIIQHPVIANTDTSLADTMTEYCTDFITTASQQEYDFSHLPEVADYQSLYVNRTEHMRNSLLKLIELRFESEARLQQNAASLERSISIANSLLAENERLRKEIEEKG